LEKEARMTRLDNDIDRLGVAAYKALMRLKKCKDWGDWMIVADGLSAGRQLAMKSAGTNRPRGRGYNETFSQWLVRHKLGEIDKPVRANLLLIAEHRSEVEEYRESLPLAERLRLNHPTVMVRHWQKATAEARKPKAPKPDYASEIDGLAAHVAELEAAREPMTLAGAREQYVTHLQKLEERALHAELEALQVTLGLIRYG
jgi:hypothetical protein